jgi:ribose 5-phosphate isomerase A
VDAKEAAARKAVEQVRSGMTLGLGSGSTATFAIQAIGQRVREEGLQLYGVPTSGRSRQLAEALNIPLVDLSDVDYLDLTIDGADEVDSALHLIKGGGGALLREKLVACASRELTIICDDRKWKAMLGAFPLPVAVVPFGWKQTFRQLQEIGKEITLRPATEGAGEPFVTDDGLYILDLHLGSIEDVPEMEHRIKQIVGVVEVGLFVNLATRVIVGYPDGHTEIRTRV